MKIGFIRSGVHPDNVLSYKLILNKRNIGVFAICETLNEKMEYENQIEVYCFEEWLSENWITISITDLEKYQDKYVDYNLWEIYYTDRYMRYKYDYEDACKLIIGSFMFWEDILEKSNATYLVSDCIIGAHNFIGMIVGEKKNVSYISIQGGRYKKYFSFFSLEEGFDNLEYNQMIYNKPQILEEELEFAKKYVDDYVNTKKHPSYIYTNECANKQLGETAKYFLKRIKNISYLWDKKFDNKFDTKQYKGRWKTLEPAMEALRCKIIKKYFVKPDFNEKFVLFPLHFQPEASTCVYARKYENQLYFIDQLSKSIPAGLMIYVKEHIVRQGHRPLAFYRQIKKYPNIKLIGPENSGHDLISHCEYVVCLTSTLGFEALMYGKSVFVCGDCFFENFSGAQRIRDVFDEKKKFLTPPVQDRDLYIKQIAYYIRSLHLCTTHEQPMRDEEDDELAKVRIKTMDTLLKYIDSIS